MTARPEAPQESVPTFVSRTTAARELEISVDTFDAWVKQGFVPPPTVQKGGILRWRWISILARLDPPAGERPALDPFDQGVRHAFTDSRARRRAAS